MPHNPEAVLQLWQTQVLPNAQDILGHPFSLSQPPLTLVSKYTGEGLGLTRAVIKTISVEGKALESVCREKTPTFPADLIGRMFSYAPRHVDLAERVIEGIAIDEIVAEQIRSKEVDLDRDEDKVKTFIAALLKLVQIQNRDRSGFRILNLLAAAPLKAFRNSPCPEVEKEIVILGAERYKLVYATAQEFILA